MTYGILKFPNVAHGEFFTIGAFTTYIVSAGNKPFITQSIALGSLVSGLIGVTSYLLIYRTLAKRGAGLISLTVASIGWSLTLRYIINFYYTGIFLYNFTILSNPVLGGLLRITPLRLGIIITALALALAFHSLLSYTKLGKAIRGTANNPILASASGINTEVIILVVWFIGSAMAGLAGSLEGIDAGLTSDMGFQIIIVAFAVVVLGGIGSFYGSILSSFALAFARNGAILAIFALNNLSPLRLGPYLLTYDINSDYSFVVAFLALALTLIFLPEGLGSLKLSKITDRLWGNGRR
jgi:branched-subunit amino acid ABC-type transport system permease component